MRREQEASGSLDGRDEATECGIVENNEDDNYNDNDNDDNDEDRVEYDVGL